MVMPFGWKRGAREQEAPGTAGTSVEGMVSEFHQTLGALRSGSGESVVPCEHGDQGSGELETANHQILASITSGVICFASQGVISLVNPAARRILRVPPSLLMLGRTPRELWAEDSPLRRLVEETLASPRNRSRIELRLPFEEGADAWVGVSVSVLRGRGAEAAGIILLMTDLTEIRALRAELSLRQRLAAMGELTACIAHNFRNSLGTILGYTTLLSRRTGGDPEARRPIEAILREVQQMEDQIRALLEGLRLDPTLDSRSDLGEVVRAVVEGIRTECDAAGIRLVLAIPTGAPAARGDAGAMGQLVSNLVRNAIQAMPSGGRLGVHLTADRECLRLLVEDSGVGIEAKDLARVFEPFFSRRAGGSGLGLALVKSTLDRLGGSIELDSAPRRGTRVSVRLPTAEGGHGG